VAPLFFEFSVVSPQLAVRRERAAARIVANREQE